MEFIYQLTDLLASLTENLLIIEFITHIGGRKLSNKRHVFRIVFCGILLTGVVSVLNSVETFSFYTIYLGFFLLVFISHFTSQGSILLRLTSCALAFFFLHSLDYLTGFTLALLFDSSNLTNSFFRLMQPGKIRLLYTLVDKTLQVVLFLLLEPVYTKIKVLNRKLLVTVLSITVFAYIVMAVLLNMIITDSVFVLQIAVILSWLFIMLCLVAVLCSVIISAQYHSRKREVEMISLTNDLMVKNYVKFYEIQTRISQQVHDFTNHLKAIERLLDNAGDAKYYVQTLLKSSRQQFNQSRCGNHVIDAIVNCKAEDALRIHAIYKFSIRLPNPQINISPVDICAVLSNQIDNALEACERIPDVYNRMITVEIWKRESFVFFKVVNSIGEGGIDLISKKEDLSIMHGLGIKNIRDTAERYQGSVDMMCKDKRFISLVMLQETIGYE